jgi:hypothetical protein
MKSIALVLIIRCIDSVENDLFSWFLRLSMPFFDSSKSFESKELPVVDRILGDHSVAGAALDFWVDLLATVRPIDA